MDNEVSFTSLCYIFENHKGQRWLQRVADIEDGMLFPPFRSERPDNLYENRDRLYRRGEPETVGMVGVWEWTATQDLSDPSKDHIESYYLKDLIPVRVVVLPADSISARQEQQQLTLEKSTLLRTRWLSTILSGLHLQNIHTRSSNGW